MRIGFPFIQNPPCQFVPGMKRAQLPQRSHIGVCLGQLQLLGDLSDLVDQVGIVALSQPRTLFFWAASNLWVGIQSSAPMLPKILDPASKMGLSRSPTSSIVASQLAEAVRCWNSSEPSDDLLPDHPGPLESTTRTESFEPSDKEAIDPLPRCHPQ